MAATERRKRAKADGRTRITARRVCVIALELALAVVLAIGAAAQVVLDPDFSSDVVGAGAYAPGLNTDYLIRQSYGETRGTNLFHRFSRFDVPTGQSATFVEDAPGSGIQRIFAHVGGTSASSIDGTLRSTIPNADLFFFNARGIVYGPDARIDVLGAFHASSADFVRFADDARFGEDAGGAAVSITSASPAAWGFLSAGGKIALEGGRLQTRDGFDLSLVGGPIRIEGPGSTIGPNVSAPDAATRLVSVAGPGEVDIDGRSAPALEVLPALGPITLSNGAVIDASGTTDAVFIVRAQDFTADDATIHAHHRGPLPHPGRAVDLAVRDTARFGSTAFATTATLTSFADRSTGQPAVGRGGDVHLEAGTLAVERTGSRVAVGTACNGSVDCTFVGDPQADGGALRIEADTLRVRGGAFVVSQQVGSGRGGDLVVRADRIDVGSEAGDVGFGGLLTETWSVNPTGAGFDPAETGRGGDLDVVARESILLGTLGNLAAGSFGNGRGGDVRVVAHDLTMRDTAGVPTSLASIQTITQTEVASPETGEGRAGDVDVFASGRVSMDSGLIQSVAVNAGPDRSNSSAGRVTLRAPNDGIRIGPFARVRSAIREGTAPPVTIETPLLLLENGGQIESTVVRDGVAAELRLTADDLVVRGVNEAVIGTPPSGLFSTTLPNAPGDPNGSSGNILIDGRRFRLEEGALVLVDSVQDGPAGRVRLGHTAPLDSVVIDAARISGETEGANASGGSLSIDARDIRIRNGARVNTGNRETGDTGDITLTGGALHLETGARIEANAGSFGTGGEITIALADRFVGRGGSIETTAAGATPTSQGGNLDVSARVVVLSETALTASAPAGAGGRIQIETQRFLPASTNPPPQATGGTRAQDGVVTILSSETTTASAVPRRTAAYEDPGRRLAARCDTRTAAQGSLYVLPEPTQAPAGEATTDARARALRRDVDALPPVARGDAAWALFGALEAALRETAADATQTRLHLARTLTRLSRASEGELAASARLRAAETLLAIRAAGSASERERVWAASEAAALYLDAGRHVEALALARRTLPRAGRLGDALAEYRTGRTLAFALDAAGERPAARDVLRRVARQGEHLRRDRLIASSAAPSRGSDDDPTGRGIADEAQQTSGRLLSMLLDEIEAEGARGDAEQSRLREVRDLLESQRSAELEDHFGDACLARQATTAPDDVAGALVLYPILLEDRVALLTGFEGRFTYHRAPATTDAVLDHARAFRRLLEKRSTRQYLRPAQHLYDAMIRPIEAQLEAPEVETLVVVPDGLLRTIPFAALHDRKRQRYLVDVKPTALVPSLRLTQPSPLARESLTVLAAGLETATAGFARLDYTRQEIADLRARFPGTRVLWDDAFDPDALAEEIRTRPYSVVHVATHGRVAADGRESFLLTRDGRLGLDEVTSMIQTTRFRRDRPLELLTLSACETAAGDETAALGLAGVALRAGARSALATLWPVNDEATARLIDAFYEELTRPDQTRAGALRVAQRRIRASPRFSHPGYWAPFLMISSWL